MCAALKTIIIIGGFVDRYNKCDAIFHHKSNGIIKQVNEMNIESEYHYTYAVQQILKKKLVFGMSFFDTVAK